MAERSKWTEPAIMVAIATFAVGALAGAAVGAVSVAWSGATFAATTTVSLSNLSTDMADIKRAITPLTSFYKSLDQRMSGFEHGLSEVRGDNLAQRSDISKLQSAVAVLTSGADAIRHDVDALQNAANGRLPGQHR